MIHKEVITVENSQSVSEIDDARSVLATAVENVGLSDVDKKFKKVVLTLLNKISKQLSELETQVQVIDGKIGAERDQKVSSTDMESVFQDFPLKTEEALRIMENKLEDNNLYNSLVNFFQKIGGSNYKEATRRISKKVLSDQVAAEYSLKGHKAKKTFITLKCCSIIIDSVQASSVVATRKDIELVLGTWLAKANERLKVPKAIEELEG